MIKIDKPIDTIAIFITTKCNLECKYCYIKKTNIDMSLETAKNSVILLSNSPGRSKELHFFGGEPLLRFNFIKKIVEFSKSIDNKIKFKITTNATLLDKEIIGFLKSNNFDIVLSIDGMEETNNFSRINKEKIGVFDDIMKSIELIKKNKIDFSVSCVVHPVQSKNIFNNLNFLMKLGAKDIHISPAVMIAWDEEDSERYVWENKKFTRFLRQNREGYKSNFIFDSENEEHQNDKAYCPLTKELSITPRGDITLCPVFMRFAVMPKRFVIGNVNAGFNQRYRDCKYNEYSKTCHNCFSKNYCHKFCQVYDIKNQTPVCKLNSKIIKELKNENT